MRIVGLDISLTSTGCADWWDGQRRSLSHGRAGKVTDTLRQRAARIAESADDTVDWVMSAHPDRVLVEAHTFAAKGGSQHDRSGLWWTVVGRLIYNDIPVIEVSPSSLKQFATGKGNATKDQVLLAVARRHPDIEFTTNDEADAITLVDIGLARWDHTLFEPNQIQQKVIDKLVWP